MRRGGESFCHRLASRYGFLLVAGCAGALLVGSAPASTQQRFASFGLAGKVDGGDTGYGAPVALQKTPEDNAPLSSGAVEAADDELQPSSTVPRVSSAWYTVSTRRKSGKRLLLIPAILLAVLAVAGMVGLLSPKSKEAPEEELLETPQVADVTGQTKAEMTGVERETLEHQDETKAARRRKNTALFVAALVVAGVLGMHFSMRSPVKPAELVVYETSPVDSSMQVNEPLDAEANSFVEQPEMSPEIQDERTVEAALQEETRWGEFVNTIVGMFGDKDVQMRRIGILTTAVFFSLVASSLAAARRSRQQRQEATNAPPSPSGNEDEADISYHTIQLSESKPTGEPQPEKEEAMAAANVQAPEPQPTPEALSRAPEQPQESPEAGEEGEPD
ncbi:putative transmembrane protein [Toxoplasma gondii TgCatPRC2]|uniref:Transmembrane protein n=14 Tax=Toxoplasma gondii TaxID=5811 RepID=A0A125YLQ5_TOXGG|nr:hypothetical protein TGME49_301690 [Toxoplasma gondii ME49]EPR56846.1 hypothetical protein TGGT1_301690 [Toxoplasma gondii GT1]ESS28538.1 putative transmembrane protein [Toxoplasma gondii VEG]KAF4645129.1 hypothetical protein TGRH88_009460 [Toxoplasma gondii]KFG28232.1 putative transmembrane protein [Toxoplasma gondii p89]KFG30353.1 putative transmembrane protein [Toxoplasma gondii GAB2-2007-GAL-DOM2]KFG35170.1 putative transmembrane protein [Toxoplasma gondii FOU]KFG57046.1 putative tran|eukprot:XP_002371671.1 hypothetical protein TGME49_301690 [Toxoplasma gondii ME49]